MRGRQRRDVPQSRSRPRRCSASSASRAARSRRTRRCASRWARRGGGHPRLGGHRRAVRGGAPGRRRRHRTTRTTTSTRRSASRRCCRDRTRPDVYFEWTGSRMAQRYADGYAADLTEAVTSGPLAGIVDEAVLPAASIDGKVVLMPHTADVTNVLWYNVPLLAEHGVTPPTTWEELLAACDTLAAAGVTPIATGNKDLWAAGNWLSHLVSRVVGEESYDAALSGEGTFATPEWETGVRLHRRARRARLRERERQRDRRTTRAPCSSSRARRPCTRSARGSSAGRSTRRPTSSSTSSTCRPCPRARPGTRAASSASRRATWSTRNSPNIDLAIEFLALVNSPENVQKFIAEAEITPLALSAAVR